MSQELSFKDPRVKAIVQAAFPGAKTRRPVRLEFRDRHHVSDFWDGGSRDETRFVKLDTLDVLTSEAIPQEARQEASNPFKLLIADVVLNAGFVIVIHIIFQGKDLGYRIIAHKDAAPALATSTVPQLGA